MAPDEGTAVAALPETPPPAEVAAAESAAIPARLYGEPMLRMPSDLYIPPDALEIFLLADQVEQQAEFQYPRHPDGAGHPAISEIRRADPPAQSGTGRRVSVDGRHAHRDQVAHATAAENERAGTGSG